jgi:hypothetical protein
MNLNIFSCHNREKKFIHVSLVFKNIKDDLRYVVVISSSYNNFFFLGKKPYFFTSPYGW